MKVSEMMKYPKLRKLLEINWKNNYTSGIFDTTSMEDRLSLGFDWMESKVPFIPSRIGVYHFWNYLHCFEEGSVKAIYPELFEVNEEEESNSVKFAKWCVDFKHASNCSGDEVPEKDNGTLKISSNVALSGEDVTRRPSVEPPEFCIYLQKPYNPDVKIEYKNPYQLISRLLLNTAHEYNGHKQVVFKTHITQEELLVIADCINNVLEAEDKEGFVTVRWSTPKSVELYLDYAWSEEGDSGHKDQLIAAWEW